MKPHFQPEPNRCYYNAQRMALAYGLRYVEGTAQLGTAPRSNHAWCIGHRGEIIDITPPWDKRGHDYQVEAEFSITEILAMARKQGGEIGAASLRGC